MRQAQSYRPRPGHRASRPARATGAWSAAPHPPYREARNPLLTGVGFLFTAIWWILTLPFRLVFGVLSLAGRMVGVAVGFSLMVVGVALGAGPFYLIGIPLFLVGLVLTLRSLG
jgi:hypothetical protein